MRNEFGVRLCAITLPMILLSACGGGGGGGVSSTPAPTTSTSTGSTTTDSTTTTSTTTAATAPSTAVATTPTTSTTTTTSSAATTTSTAPTPATQKSTVNYDDAEYRRSNAVITSGAISAYQAGATGKGVKIAVIDSGLTDAASQFTGRIDAASADMAGSRGIGDEGGHGTSVAAVAAAGRNGSDIMGVAFDATLLIARTDTIGSCTSEKGCSHADSAIAKGVDLARANGARVINISLGGYSASNTLINAVRQAAQAGIVVVISAGNDGAADPDAFAQMAAASGMNGMVIIAGSHGADKTISSFSDKAGSYGNYYLAALGDGVRAFNQEGKDYYYTGTSYSAPTIAGAVAVLAQAFPTLTGKQIVDLLYSTATDAGDAGIDSVFGRGLLNLAKAFQPQGSSSLAGSAVPVSTTAANGVTGAAMGDAAQSGASSGARAVILDGYGRAYDVDLGRTLAANPGARALGNALVGGMRSTGLSSGPIAVSINVAADRHFAPADVQALGLDPNSARVARMLSARVLARVGDRAQALFGFREGAAHLSAMLDGRAELPFIVARDATSTFGVASVRGPSLALRRDLGFAGLTLAGESGSTAPLRIARNRDAASFSAASARLDRRFGALSLAAGIGMMREDRSVLGARFGAAFGGGGASTATIDLRGAYDLGAGWRAAIAARQSWTMADRTGSLTGGRLVSNAFAIDLSHFGATSRFGLRVSQPLRVASGGLKLTLPTSYDYTTGSVGYSRSTLNLAPQGREIDVEASYGLALGKGWLDANAFFRRQPDHFASAAPDAGLALRYGVGF